MGNLVGVTASDTVNTEVNAALTAALLMFLQADPAPASTGGSGPSAIVEMMSNMGGVALAVLVVLLCASAMGGSSIWGRWEDCVPGRIMCIIARQRPQCIC